MNTEPIAPQAPRFQLLSDAQRQQLACAALEILERTGVDVAEDEARALLKHAGVAVDGLRARIPPRLAEWAARTAPASVLLCDSRDGTPRMRLEGSSSYFGTGSDTIATIDLESGERRPTVKTDVANAARLCDALANIDFVMSMGMANDVPTAVSDVHNFDAMVSNTRKPMVATAWNLPNLRDIVEMAEAVAGGAEALRRNPFIIIYSEPLSPLHLSLEPTQKILYAASKGLPVICGTGKVGGATCPVTIAGAVAQGTAEALAGVLIAQLKREGTPIIFGGERLQLDMATGLGAYGAPEFMMSVVANAEMARYYSLPSWSYAGCSDAKIFDQQAVAEATMMTMLSAFAGANLNHDVGYLEAGLTSSLEAVVAGEEIIGAVRRIAGGVEITAETLALDLIDQVGPGGEFLTTDHTLRHFREDWFPRLFDRTNYETWVRKGKRTLGERATEKAREILHAHLPVPLDEGIRSQISRIIARAESRAKASEL